MRSASTPFTVAAGAPSAIGHASTPSEEIAKRGEWRHFCGSTIAEDDTGAFQPESDAGMMRSFLL